MASSAFLVALPSSAVQLCRWRSLSVTWSQKAARVSESPPTPSATFFALIYWLTEDSAFSNELAAFASASSAAETRPAISTEYYVYNFTTN